jgi:hypothetical protein
MKRIFISLVAVASLASADTFLKDQYSKVPEGYSLSYVFEIFRHGARTPTTHSLNDTSKFHGIPEGHLTFPGMREHDVLGGHLRKRFTHELDFL